MIFLDKDRKQNIEQYVAHLKDTYAAQFPFGLICEEAGIDLLENRALDFAYAFHFPDRRGIVYDPGIRQSLLQYYLTKKLSHHLLGHFERETPIWKAEKEADCFTAAAIRPPWLMVETPLWTSLLISSSMLQRRLANHYSRLDQPLLL
ncbi:MAG: hypothetical protein AABX31_00065 [Nanoarchaeota archaeon]